MEKDIFAAVVLGDEAKASVGIEPADCAEATERGPRARGPRSQGERGSGSLEYPPRAGRISASHDQVKVFGSLSLRSLANRKFDAIAVSEHLSVDHRVMEKQIITTLIARDKSKPFVRVIPLDHAGSHLDLLRFSCDWILY
jgi:hypothetical protein